MTRNEYLAALTASLSFLDEETRAAALSFYGEMLEDRMEDGMTEESAVAAMESPEAIAARLRAETGASDQPPSIPFPLEGDTFSGTLEQAMKSVEEAVRRQEETAQVSKDTANYEKRRLTVPLEELRAVQITARNKPVRLTVDPQATQAVLTYFSCQLDKYQATVENGMLTLSPVGKREGIGFSFFGQGIRFLWQQPSPTVELILPPQALIDVQVDTTNGSICAQGLDALCATRLRTTNGRIILENMQCKHLDVSSTNGRLELRNLRVRQGLVAQTTNGRIEAAQVESGEALSLTSSNASLTALHCKAGGPMTLHTSNSRLAVEIPSAPALSLHTSNGSIRGTLPGPQSAWGIDSSTSNGHSNSLPRQQAGEKPLSVHTSNGSIALHFADQPKATK